MQNEWEQRGCKGDLNIRLPVEGVGRCCNCTNTCIFSGELSSGSPGLRTPPPHSSFSLVTLADIPLSPRTQKWERIPKFHQNLTLSSTLSGRRYQNSPDRKLWWLEKRRKAKHTEWNLTPGHKLLGIRQHILNFYGNEKKQPATMGGVHKRLKNQWL